MILPPLLNAKINTIDTTGAQTADTAELCCGCIDNRSAICADIESILLIGRVFLNR